MITAAGIDTWSVGWYVGEGSPAERALESMATVPGSRSKLLPEKVFGHTVGWFPGSRLMFAEGHPVDTGGLARSEDVPTAYERLMARLADVGILPPRIDLRPVGGAHELRRVTGGVGFAGVRRLDCTADLRFASGLEGLAVLAGVAALPVPRIKKGIVTEVGGRRVETVNYLGTSGKRLLARWYDKGVHPETAQKLPRGEWVRPEDQRRFGSGTRPPLSAAADPAYVRGQFVARFQTLYKAAKGVKVGGVTDLAKRLAQLQEEGAITPSQAKRIAGHLVLDSVGAHRQARSTVYHDAAEARELGLVLAAGVLDDVEVDLGEAIEQALDSDCWGVG